MKKILFLCALCASILTASAASPGALGGLFTVNDQGKQVQFSQGNLRYQSSTATWSFADKQWDVIGSANVSGGNLADVIDLFGWGTGDDPTRHEQDADFDWNDPDAAINNPANYHYLDFVDWGKNAISNGGNHTGEWRTLTKAEWRYLLYERENADSLVAFGRISEEGTYVNGLILLPDDFWKSFYLYPPKTCKDQGFVYSYGAYRLTSTSNVYQTNVYTEEAWSNIANGGAVFLPAAGGRTYNMQISNVGVFGNYWTSDERWEDFDGAVDPFEVYDMAYEVMFGKEDTEDWRIFSDIEHRRDEGMSVRLVQDPVEIGDDFYATPRFGDEGVVLHLKVTSLSPNYVEVMQTGHTVPDGANLFLTNVDYKGQIFYIRTVAEQAYLGNIDTLVISPDVLDLAPAWMDAPELITFGMISGNDNYSVVDGVLYSKDKKTLLRCPAKNAFTNGFPSTVDSLAQNAFAYCTMLDSITLPNTIKTLTEYSFMMSSIRKITIPASVTTVGYTCLNGCNKLEDINFEAVGNIRVIAWDAFLGTKVVNDQQHQEGLRRIGNLAISWQTPDNKWPETLEFPEGIENIITGFYYFSNVPFSNYNTLRKIVLPSTIKNICRGAFTETLEHKMDSLETVVVKAATVPTIEWNSDPLQFYSSKYLTLQVPCEAVEAYKAALHWKFGFDKITSIPVDETIEINFLTNPYDVIWPSSRELPGCVEVTGSPYNTGEHGYYSPEISLHLAAGNYKLTVGNCQYSNTHLMVRDVRTMDQLDLINANGQTISELEATDGCFTGSNWDKMSSAWLTLDADKEVRIYCPQYTPYFILEPVSDVPQPVTTYQVTFLLGDAEGMAPDAVELTAGETYTIPVNRTVYKADYTLAGWNDGSKTWTPGETMTVNADVELTPLFVSNSVDLLDASEEVTVRWYFGESNGAPSVQWQGGDWRILVTQATVGDETIDVRLRIDPSAGKFANKGRGDEWAQVNNVTSFVFPSKAGAVVKARSYDEPLNGNVDMVGYVSWDESNRIATYNVTSPYEGTSQLNNYVNTYYSYLEVVLPATIHTGMEQSQESKVNSQKTLRDGQLFIVRDGKMFNVLGVELR